MLYFVIKILTKAVNFMDNPSICENCMYYDYDYDYGYYVCLMELDQDEMERFLRNTFTNCPYFRYGDEYKIVHKQI